MVAGHWELIAEEILIVAPEPAKAVSAEPHIPSQQANQEAD